MMKRSSSPGPDGITAEHLTTADSSILWEKLCSLFSAAFSNRLIPRHLSESVIIPALKKTSLDPNEVNNYRPITISSVFAKIAESLMLPDADDLLCSTQFGFRPGRDTSMACSLLSDIIVEFNSMRSPVYVCSLDAEKCFDSIWHEGLFYKLHQMQTFPAPYWAFLFKWYRSSSVTVCWNGDFSEAFRPSRGTKQGSLLSPLLFNLFVNDLLCALQASPKGLRIGPSSYNSMAYADDLTLFAALPEDLQDLIDMCTDYADRWRFRYSYKKTKCLVAGRCHFSTPPKWTLKGAQVETSDSISILGVEFSSSGDCCNHPAQRASACRRAIYSFADRGALYPGLCTDAKVHLWSTIGLPTLTYALEAVHYPFHPPAARPALMALSPRC